MLPSAHHAQGYFAVWAPSGRAQDSPPPGACLAPGQVWSRVVAVSKMTANSSVVCVSVSQGPQQDRTLHARSEPPSRSWGWPSSLLLPTSSLPGTMPLKNLLHLNFRDSRRGQAPYMGVQCTVDSESSWSNGHVSAQMASGCSFLNLWRSMVTACPKLTVKVKLAFSSSFCLSQPLPTPSPNMSQVPGTEQCLHVIAYCFPGGSADRATGNA